MKNKGLMLILVLTLVLSGCSTGTEVATQSPVESVSPSPEVKVNEPVITPEAYINEIKEQKTTVNVTYPHIEGVVDPEIQSGINERFSSFINEIIDDFESWAKEDFENLSAGQEATVHSLNLSYEVTTLSASAVSVLISESTYSGGLYPNSRNYGFTFSLDTGKEFFLSDLFTADYDYVTAINNEIITGGKLFSGIDGSYEVELPQFESILENHSFYFRDSRLVIFYSEGEIAPHAVGYIEFYPSDDLTLNLISLF